MNNKLFYQCFSGKQKNYLLNKGHDYVLRAKDYYNNNIFWLFIKNEQLDADLQNWHDNNPTFQK
jgi:hypothetical protein